jgi:integrase/recombinase XerD
MLLDDALQEFLYHIQVKNYTERTRKGYKKFIKYLQNKWQIEEVEEVKPSHIKTYR